MILPKRGKTVYRLIWTFMYRRSALAKIQRTFMCVKTMRSAAFATGAEKHVPVTLYSIRGKHTLITTMRSIVFVQAPMQLLKGCAQSNLLPVVLRPVPSLPGAGALKGVFSTVAETVA